MKYKVITKHYRVPFVSKEWGMLPKSGIPSDLCLARYQRGRNPKWKWVYGKPYPKGGKTEVTIQVFSDDDDSNPVASFTGVAYCSLEDNFCYRIGRRIALGRAMKEFEQWRDTHVVGSVRGQRVKEDEE